MSLQLSIILPTVDKAGRIAATLDALAPMRVCGRVVARHAHRFRVASSRIA